MNSLAIRIRDLDVPEGSVGIFWLGQAGFAIKVSSGEVLYIDAYLSYMCETTLEGGIGSKRLFPPPLSHRDITQGILASTHLHQDHNDEETIEAILTQSPEARFIGPRSCVDALMECGIPEDRLNLVDRGDTYYFEGGSIRAVFADHGEDDPFAVGYLVQTDDGVSVYHTGDTTPAPENLAKDFDIQPDVIITCINGTFGNLNGEEAAKLALRVGAKIAIPCHFWTFIAQNVSPLGTPGAFLDACAKWAPGVEPTILRIGEHILYHQVDRGEGHVEWFPPEDESYVEAP